MYNYILFILLLFFCMQYPTIAAETKQITNIQLNEQSSSENEERILGKYNKITEYELSGQQGTIEHSTKVRPTDLNNVKQKKLTKIQKLIQMIKSHNIFEIHF